MAFSCQSLKVALCALLAGCCVLVADTAEPAGNRQGVTAEEAAARKQAIDAIVAKIVDAQRVLDESQKTSDSDSQVVGNGSSVDSESRTPRGDLQSVEQKLLASLPADSDLRKAHAELLRTEEEVDLHSQRIMESREYRERMKLVAEAVNGAVLRIAIHKEAFERDAAYKAALWEYRYAKKRFNALKAEQFSQNEEWASVSNASRQGDARQKRSRVSAKIINVAVEKESPSSDDPVVAAQATIAECKTALRQLGVKNVNTFIRECKKNQ